MTFERYSSSTPEETSDTFPLGTNSDRYKDMGVMTFTPGREIPARQQIGIKVSNGTKITYICGTTYTAHDGGVLTLSKDGGVPFTETATTTWPDNQPGTMRIGAAELFVDDSGDSSSGSESSSSESSSSESSSGGGY